MAGADALKPPRWLKPANKVFIAMSRLGLSFGGESPVVLTVPGRRSERVRMVELPAEDARPVLRAFPAEAPTGVGFMKRSGLITDGRPEEFEALAGRCAVFRLDPLRA
jgi:hypothetical protein